MEKSVFVCFNSGLALLSLREFDLFRGCLFITDCIIVTDFIMECFPSVPSDLNDKGHGGYDVKCKHSITLKRQLLLLDLLFYRNISLN